MLEDVEGDPIEEGEVLCGVACSFSTEVFSEADIECPMQFVFNAPVLADGLVEPSGIGFEAGDVEAGFGLCLARRLVVTLGPDAHQTL